MRGPQKLDDRYLLPDSPCRCCSKAPCYAKCILWKAWFTKRWQSIQISAERFIRRKR